MFSPVLLILVAGAFAIPFSPQDETENSPPLWVRSGKFQGDMILDEEQMRNPRVSLKDQGYRWPNATIIYEISDEFTSAQKDFIRESLQFYNENTCVTVRQRQPSDKNYVYVTKEDTGCWSYVGKRSSQPQQLNLQHNDKGTCLVSATVQHEFLHALGVHHEQCDPTRDDWVEILWENIQSGMEHNFNKYSDSQVTGYGCDYDLKSVMHYDRFSFTINDQPTIRSISDPDLVLGNRVSLTELDIKKLNCMYVKQNAACKCECPNPE